MGGKCFHRFMHRVLKDLREVVLRRGAHVIHTTLSLVVSPGETDLPITHTLVLGWLGGSVSVLVFNSMGV